MRKDGFIKLTWLAHWAAYSVRREGRVIGPPLETVDLRSNGPSTSSGRTEKSFEIDSPSVRAELVEALFASKSTVSSGRPDWCAARCRCPSARCVEWRALDKRFVRAVIRRVGGMIDCGARLGERPIQGCFVNSPVNPPLIRTNADLRPQPRRAGARGWNLRHDALQKIFAKRKEVTDEESIRPGREATS